MRRDASLLLPGLSQKSVSPFLSNKISTPLNPEGQLSVAAQGEETAEVVPPPKDTDPIEEDLLRRILKSTNLKSTS